MAFDTLQQFKLMSHNHIIAVIIVKADIFKKIPICRRREHWIQFLAFITWNEINLVIGKKEEILVSSLQ